jgi:hypothetical protein
MWPWLTFTRWAYLPRVFNAFHDRCIANYVAGECDLGAICKTFNAGVDATSVKYAEVWTDIKRIEWVSHSI